MEDELYKIFLENIRQKLTDKVKGNISASMDDRHIYIGIYRFGHWWNYTMYNVDLVDVNTLNSDISVELILGAYRAFINDSYFVL